MADGKSFTKNESTKRLGLNIQQVEASPSQGVSNATYIRVDRSWHQSIGTLVVRTHTTPDWDEAASGRISIVWWVSTGSAQQYFWSLKLLIHSLRVTCFVTVERLYGDDKKKALSNFYDHFCEEIDQLFFKKFQELSDLNIGEGETTRIVGRLLNAKTNVVDQIRGWRGELVLTTLRFEALSLMVLHQQDLEHQKHNRKSSLWAWLRKPLDTLKRRVAVVPSVNDTVSAMKEIGVDLTKDEK